MPKINRLKVILVGSAAVSAIATVAYGASFNIPAGSLEAALDAYTVQSGVAVIAATDQLRNTQTKGVVGDLSPDAALTRILKGTGFVPSRDESGAINILRNKQQSSELELPAMQLAQASPPSRAAVETVTVTSSKLGGADVQSIPISITALSQEQLTATQTAGGPDLVKQVPNLTFSKTNFTGYNIQIRGIGTQAISVTTDPAVAVAFNDTPFLRNHFFEQEFYDLSQAEVLRGPQGTLYGRNATAGVVNLTSAKPTDQFEAMASGEIGSYHQRRFEGMINIPLVDDRLDLRVAGEWTKRQGYSFNQLTDSRIDGRDLWSGRVTLAWKPIENLQAYLVWEHFSENDDRMRTAKQLCKTAQNPATINGVSTGTPPGNVPVGVPAYNPLYYLSQGCEATSLYSPEAFQVPNGYSLSYASAIGIEDQFIRQFFNPYSSTTQSTNLRVIESAITPHYRAKNDTLEFNADYQVTSALTITSQTGYNNDSLFSSEDYNRFNTAPGVFSYYINGQNAFGWNANPITLDPSVSSCSADIEFTNDGCLGVFCDPQVGCSNRLVAEDLSEERAWQFSQELRLSSKFEGPLNFSVGGNYLHYETEENYYVFINTLTNYVATGGGGGASYIPGRPQWIPGVTDNSFCVPNGTGLPNPHAPHNPVGGNGSGCSYIDPNPITNLNGQGHNYFLSKNPYLLDSYAAFGEAYYDVLKDLKITAGLRWTADNKHFVDIPSELLLPGYGYPATGVVDQQWREWTGRAAANWTPKLSFTDQTLIYGSYAHGYKAGGANPPGAVLLTFFATDVGNPIHPLTFKPEFVDAFEVGSKNTLLDGSLTLNADIFYYNYENYQISRIVDRTAINDNFDAHVKGAEVEGTYEPIPGLRINFAGGWEDTSLAKGSHSVDLMDRTAGNPGWMVIKPFITQASNCVLPTYVTAVSLGNFGYGFSQLCGLAYSAHLDPVTDLPYVPNPTVSNPNGGWADPPPGYIGFDPTTAPNNGQGFDKNLSGNELPNAPPFTVSAGAQYSMPLTSDWAGTLRTDYYWQDYSWARVFNDNPYDRIRGYTSVNLSLIFTSQNGWQVMLYDKNVFNETAITGTFLNSDDSGLTTNVFLTDPKLIGVRVTKNW